MRQNCEIEKRQAVRNIEYQKKTGEKGKRVQPTDIYNMENYKSVHPDPAQTRAGILFDINHIYGPAGSFHQKCQLCLLQKVLQTVNSMGSRSHSFPLLRRRAGEQPEVRNSQFCGKEASTHFPNVIQHFSSHFCCNYLISLITDK